MVTVQHHAPALTMDLLDALLRSAPLRHRPPRDARGGAARVDLRRARLLGRDRAAGLRGRVARARAPAGARARRARRGAAAARGGRRRGGGRRADRRRRARPAHRPGRRHRRWWSPAWWASARCWRWRPTRRSASRSCCSATRSACPTRDLVAAAVLAVRRRARPGGAPPPAVRPRLRRGRRRGARPAARPRAAGAARAAGRRRGRGGAGARRAARRWPFWWRPPWPCGGDAASPGRAMRGGRRGGRRSAGVGRDLRLVPRRAPPPARRWPSRCARPRRSERAAYARGGPRGRPRRAITIAVPSASTARLTSWGSVRPATTDVVAPDDLDQEALDPDDHQVEPEEHARREAVAQVPQHQAPRSPWRTSRRPASGAPRRWWARCRPGRPSPRAGPTRSRSPRRRTAGSRPGPRRSRSRSARPRRRRAAS